MATISSTGIGSGLDINSLVSQLVAAERANPEKRLVSEEARLTTEFTALATLKGGMSAFQIAVNNLRAANSLDLNKVTVGDEQAFTATVTSGAAAGKYDVEVKQLATASRIGSAVYQGGPDTVVGTGALTIAVGGKSFTVDITQDSDTLAQIRDAINASKDNPGVRATLIRDTDGTGSYLVLSGAATGKANEITVSTDSADPGLTKLVADLTNFDAQRDVKADDAIVFVSGYEVHSASNTVTGALDGVTLNLRKAEVGKLVSLAVERDDTAIIKKVENFVSGFNTLAAQITGLSRYDAASKTAGPLLGDAMLRGIDSQLRRVLGEAVAGLGGDFRSLASIGISTTINGTLQLDSTKLRKALTDAPEAVAQIFSATDSGVAVRLSKFLDERLSVGGEIASRDARIADRRKSIDVRRDALDARMQLIEKRYLKQFTALDSMLAQLQTTSNFLSQQINNLSNLNSSD